MNIEIQSLCKQFGRIIALDSVSLGFKPGDIVPLLGPNGAGKSTLLRCLAGIASPDRGSLLFDGELFTRGRLDLRKKFYYIPDFPLFFQEWTPLRFLGIINRAYDRSIDGLQERIHELLSDFDLMPLIRRPIADLSRGQIYKVFLTGLISVDPALWLLDEPFASGMDSSGLAAFKRHARAAAQRGSIIVYSTQILELAEKFSSQVCVLHQGKVRAMGPLETIQPAGAASPLEQLFEQLREEK